jgi:predicted aspartyl protease
LNKNPINAIVDSGADLSVITTPLAKKLGLKITLGGKDTIVTVDGQRRNVHGNVTAAKIQIQDKLVPIDLLVVDSNRDNLLLGMDWIMTHKANLLFTEMKLEFQMQGRKFRIPITVEYTAPRIHFIETPQHEPHEYESYMIENLSPKGRDNISAKKSKTSENNNTITKEPKSNIPKYILVVLYDHEGIKMSLRTDWDKPIYNMWQTPGGKVEKGETSMQAALRELKEETGIKARDWDLKYLFNNNKYNTDVYLCRMQDH